MAYVPKPLNPEWTGWDIPESGGTPSSVTVYATKTVRWFWPVARTREAKAQEEAEEEDVTDGRVAALSLLEQLAEAADLYLRRVSGPLLPPADRQAAINDLAAALAAVRSGRAGA